MFRKIKNIYHFVHALAANWWYGFPSRKLKVIGVTGTDGKTTTTHLIYHILSTSGRQVSMISTIFAKIGGIEYETGFHVTTPDAVSIPRYLQMAVDKGQEYFILETTSHRLEQNQLEGVNFKAAVITNITHEHLDYHKTIEEYAQSKFKVIQMAEVGLLNADDEVTIISNILTNTFKIKTYGLLHKADYSVDFKKEIPQLADFNAYNYLAAYAVCRELGLTDTEIRKSLLSFKLPLGRIDIVYDKKFKVIVDFAHTPNALVNILKTVRKQHMPEVGRLIHVFGSAGLRDNTKRFAMGQASATCANISYITEEDYRSEDPQKIANEVGEGFGDKHYFVELDRKTAIQKAITDAQPGDVVVITGKGHEKSLCRGKTEYPWSDIDCVKSYVSSLS